jgi:hypothetical protein
LSFSKKVIRNTRTQKKPIHGKIQGENAIYIIYLMNKHRYEIPHSGCYPNQNANQLLTSKRQKILTCKDLANLRSQIDALLDSGVKIVTTLVQRNLSPRASLLKYIKRLGVSVKEKTPHQKGEALNFTFCAPNPDAGGRTTPGSDCTNNSFALKRNIVAIYKNIIAISAIVVSPKWGVSFN